MTISELIINLEKEMREHGDIQITIATGVKTTDPVLSFSDYFGGIIITGGTK